MAIEPVRECVVTNGATTSAVSRAWHWSIAVWSLKSSHIFLSTSCQKTLLNGALVVIWGPSCSIGSSETFIIDVFTSSVQLSNRMMICTLACYVWYSREMSERGASSLCRAIYSSW